MNVSTNKDVLEISGFVDTSGDLGIDEHCVITSIWCRSSHISEIGQMLQLIRDIHDYQAPFRFVKLRGQTDAMVRTALDWLAALLRSAELKTYVCSVVIPKLGFDLSYYGGNPETALNRHIDMNIRAALSQFNLPLSLMLHVDGTDEGFDPTHGVLNYLKKALPYKCARSDHQPILTSVSASAVQKHQIEPRGPKRHRQDLTALADLMSGTVRRAYRGKQPWNAKAQLAYEMASKWIDKEMVFPFPRNIEIKEYSKQSGFSLPSNFPILSD